jgi:hypothetical protein
VGEKHLHAYLEQLEVHRRLRGGLAEATESAVDTVLEDQSQQTCPSFIRTTATNHRGAAVQAQDGDVKPPGGLVIAVAAHCG